MGFNIVAALVVFIGMCGAANAVSLSDRTDFSWTEVSAGAAGVVAILVALLGISRCVHEFTCRNYQNEPEALRSITIGGGENTKL